MNSSFADWRRDYLDTNGQAEDPLTTVWCPMKGCDRRVGVAWRHADYGLLFEGYTRTSDVVETARIIGTNPRELAESGLKGWTVERWLIPLENGLSQIASRPSIPATCLRGHKVAVAPGEIRSAAMGRTRALRASLRPPMG